MIKVEYPSLFPVISDLRAFNIEAIRTTRANQFVASKLYFWRNSPVQELSLVTTASVSQSVIPPFLTFLICPASFHPAGDNHANVENVQMRAIPQSLCEQ